MVIDASVAFKWLVTEPGSEEAIGWIGQAELIAPTLLHAEIGNALRKRVMQNEIVGGYEMTGHLERVAQLVRTVDETPSVARALQIAVDLRHPIYDCIYLALAEAMDEQLLTADVKFVAAVGDHPLAARLVALA